MPLKSDIYKASIPAAITQIPAPMTSNAFTAEAALLVAWAAGEDALLVPADLVAEAPDLVAEAEPAVEEPVTLEEPVPLEEPPEEELQISAEMVAVLVTSSEEQALARQGVTDAVMAALPVVHWQMVSVRPQDVVAMAVAKQETEQAGKSAIVTAYAAEKRDRTTVADVNFMMTGWSFCFSGRNLLSERRNRVQDRDAFQTTK